MNASVLSRVVCRVACRPVSLLVGLGCALAAFAQAPQPQDFAFRAQLEVPASANVARAGIPAEALARMQSADARDVRIFNAAGEVVPFALAAPPAPAALPLVSTPAFSALPLYAAVGGNAKSQKGTIQVRIGDGQRSVWVQIDGQQPAAGATKIDSVIFDTRGQKQPLSALKVQAGLPANAPVRMTVSTSSDLASWMPAQTRGRLFRFEGAGAPANHVLEFEQPLSLDGRYLRLDWSGQEGVTVESVTGLIASGPAAPARIRAALPALQAQAKGLEVQLPFATPIAALVLTTPQANALLPVRILGRNEPSQPWRVLSSTVVYRLGAAGNDSTNPPVALHRASVKWLRVESTQGADLSGTKLDASAEFDPVQLVFVANGSAPFQLAAGRTDTPGAALPLSVLSAALAGKRIDELPEAVVGAGTVAPTPEAETGFLAVIQQAGISQRAALLWAVLIAGVLLLGGVAWSLMRQLKAAPPPAE
ncbi:MAG: DUF3999 family protein [Pseudomonadota bacterium]